MDLAVSRCGCETCSYYSEYCPNHEHCLELVAAACNGVPFASPIRLHWTCREELHLNGVDLLLPNKSYTNRLFRWRLDLSTLFEIYRQAHGLAPVDDCVRYKFEFLCHQPHSGRDKMFCTANIDNSCKWMDKNGRTLLEIEDYREHFKVYLVLFFLYANQYLYPSEYMLQMREPMIRKLYCFDSVCMDYIVSSSGIAASSTHKIWSIDLLSTILTIYLKSQWNFQHLFVYFRILADIVNGKNITKAAQFEEE